MNVKESLLISYLSSTSIMYYGFAAAFYCCIAVIVVFVIVFGRRARRNVKKERVTSLPEGFSPLDVKRIFIGKIYPRRLTRALITYWAECGFIRVIQLDKNNVRIIKVKDMPYHADDDAVFFDRGTYVRERDLFNKLMRKVSDGRPVNILRPLFEKNEAQVGSQYAVREDVGVYSAKHYTLKIITIVLCIVAALFAQIAGGVNGGTYMGMLGVGTACIGLCVLMFANDIPIAFKGIWCGFWLAASTVAMSVGFSFEYDPFGIVITSIILLYVGPLFIVRFVDYREKNNLDDYSDLVNYRKFLLFAPAWELQKLDYYKVLPLLYAFRIKSLVRRKFGDVPPPSWYKNETETKGRLL